MLSDSDFGSGTDDRSFWSSGWTEPDEEESGRYQPIRGGEGIDSQSDEDTNSDRPKCPICLVNSTLNVKTNCGHDFCLQCIFRMWTSENSDNDEDESERPFICPMCRLTVTGLIWKGSNQLIPNQLSEYNQLYCNYKPQARQNSQKYSSG